MPWLDGHGADPLARGHREARHVQELDGARWRSSRSRCRCLARSSVRSGVLTSGARVRHRPWRGVFILVFLAVVIGGSLTLLRGARRTGRQRAAAFDPLSRESLLLANNVLLVVSDGERDARHACNPLSRSDALELGKISVGPPWLRPRWFYPPTAALCCS